MVLSDLARHDPRRIGRYRVAARVGVGGMGVVYLAHDRRGRPFAVKVLRAELAESPGFRARFRREIVAAGSLESACTARFVAGDPDADPPYFVTEYVPGPTLEAYITPSDALRGEALRGFAVGIADAVSAIGRAGLVHRDLKPTNVLLTRVGPKIIDFGVAQGDDTLTLTETGQRIGTPRWMAPEQASGAPITPATDVFAWGALVAFAGTGTPPFGSGEADAVLFRVVHAVPDLTGLDPSMTPIVERALAKHPEERPSVEELLDELLAEPSRRPGGSLDDGSVSGSETKAGTRQDVAALLERAWPHDIVVDTAIPSRRSRRGRTLVAAAAVIVALAVVATGVLLAEADEPGKSGSAVTARRSARIVRTSSTTSPQAPSTVPAATTVPSSVAPAAAPATQKRIFSPFVNGNRTPVLELTAHLTGNCIDSEVDYARPDAFRCFGDDSQVLDPCFRDGFNGGTELVCPIGPTASTAVGLQPTGGIEGDTSPRPSTDVAAPWALILADGQECEFVGGGTGAVAGQRLNYTCPNGSLFGGPDRSGTSWTVLYQATGQPSVTAVPVTTAWF